nr:hypothetical protein [Tanacetum cinerariifolium]
MGMKKVLQARLQSGKVEVGRLWCFRFPLRVIIAFRSSFGLVIVLLVRVPKPGDKASPLAVEESGVDEPELGNPELDKLVLDKLEVGFDRVKLPKRIAFSAVISGSKEEVIELDDSLRWAEVSQSLCIDSITMSQSQTVIEGIYLSNGLHVVKSQNHYSRPNPSLIILIVYLKSKILPPIGIKVIAMVAMGWFLGCDQALDRKEGGEDNEQCRNIVYWWESV